MAALPGIGTCMFMTNHPLDAFWNCIQTSFLNSIYKFCSLSGLLWWWDLHTYQSFVKPSGWKVCQQLKEKTMNNKWTIFRQMLNQICHIFCLPTNDLFHWDPPNSYSFSFWCLTTLSVAGPREGLQKQPGRVQHQCDPKQG